MEGGEHVVERAQQSQTLTSGGGGGANGVGGGGSAAAQVLDLQRRAGNRVVGQLLAQRETGTSPGAPPPASPGADQGLVDEYTKRGNAKKVASAIANAAKFAGLGGAPTNLADKSGEGKPSDAAAAALKHTPVQGGLTPSKIAGSMGGPEEMVKAAGSSWKEVKNRYVSSDPDTMRLILQYRVHEVGRIYKQVIDEMWAVDAPKRKANKAALDAETDAPYPEEKLFQLNDLQFAMMGSTDLTSDYDVSFDHVVTKPWVGVTAVKLFNQKFREKWGKESGTVFDTNVYTQGFMPQNMSNIPAGLEGSIRERAKAVTVPEDKAGATEAAELKARLEAQAKEAGQVRTKMAQDAVEGRAATRATDPYSQRQMFSIEDLMSLVKIRKFMSASAWKHYSELLLGGLPPGSPAYTAAVATLDKADLTYLMLNQQLKAKMAQLSAGRAGVDKDDLELEASNRLYEEYLTQATDIVQANKGVLGPDAIAAWTTKQSTALYYANEAYHTSGPVESTVIGQQMGIAMKQTPEQFLQAVNEQTGFVVEQHHSNKTKPPGRFLWKSAKYVDRICAVVDQAKKDVGARGFTAPSHFDVLKPLSAELLKIKKQEVGDTQKDTLAVAALEARGVASQDAYEEFVVELNADVNQQLRTIKPAGKR